MEKRLFQKRLLLSFLLATITPILLMVTFVMQRTTSSLLEQQFRHLETVRRAKSKALASYIHDSKSDLELLTDVIAEATLSSPPQADIPLQMFKLLPKMVTVQGYKSVILLNSSGKPFYHTQKDLRLRDTLQKNPYEPIFKTIQKRKRITLQDYFIATELDKTPLFLMGNPIFAGDTLQSIVLLEIAIDSISSLLMEREGLGMTEEVYLVGSDNLMRSDSYLDPNYRSVINSFRHPNRGRVDTEATKRALQGESASAIVTDYNENDVLSSFAPFSVEELRWALLVEIDKNEVLASIRKTHYILVFITLLSILIIVVVALFIIRKLVTQCTGEHCLRGLEMERELLKIVGELNHFAEKFRRW